MRFPLGSALMAAGLLGLGCRNDTTAIGTTLSPPQRLAYELEPSGDPNLPTGILLVWDDVSSPALASYRIYSRGSTGSTYGLRGETSSNTFHDNGVPHLQYFVTAVDVDGGESDASNVITVDERLQLPRPSSLSSISLNQAVHLQWADNAALSDSQRFKWYRLYSASYSLDSLSCRSDWVLEGTTVSDEFLATLLSNGVPLCFAVSAISVEGYESLWSPLRQGETPRPDARNVLAYAFEDSAARSGFRFWSDANGNGRGDAGELGLVQDGNRADVDFSIRRAADSSLWIVPKFVGDSMQVYGSVAVPDLTSIDYAPAGGYSPDMFEAVPGFGYVFQRNENGQYHYAALRVTHVSRHYMIFDWSVQTDPGNPELVAPKGRLTAGVTGSQVPRSQ
jgi:hypothetical protein